MINLIKPFEFSPFGTCLKCGSHTLILMTKDIDAIKINKNGMMGENISLKHQSKIVCTTCNSTFEYIQSGMYIKPISDEVNRVNICRLNSADKNPFNI